VVRLIRSVAIVVACLILGSCGNPKPTTAEAQRPKIGFIFVGRHDDLGYNQAAWEGSEALAVAFPDVRFLRQEDVPESPAAEAALESMVRRGAKILFATSFGHLEYAYRVAKRHPEVVVLHQGGLEPSPKLNNLGTYWGTVYEPVYQAGIAAGSATKTNKLGYVVAFPIPATFLNVDAFTLGAQSVNPKVTTHVVSTNSWCDPAKQKAAVQDLLSQGVDVLTEHQDCTRTILEAAESAGVLAVGYHADGSDVAPKSWLVGSVWNWGPLFVDIVRTVQQGMFRASKYNGDYRGGYRTGNNPFVLTEFGPGVTPEAQSLINSAGKRFKEGGSPFIGPIADRDQKQRIAPSVTPSLADLDRLDYFVPGVVGEVPKG